jgi:hypothetical protein
MILDLFRMEVEFENIHGYDDMKIFWYVSIL